MEKKKPDKEPQLASLHAGDGYKALSMRGWNRCVYCGKFFSIKEFDDSKIKIDYTPDTAFTIEEIAHYHKKCAL